LPRHPLTNKETYQLYEYEEGFETIDWDTMHTLGTEDRCTKSVKMAECLTNLIDSPKVFHRIYVKNEEIREIVEEKLKGKGITKNPPYINIGRWL